MNDPKRTLDTVESNALIVAFDTAVKNLREAKFPAVYPEEITDDGETYMGLRCPHCGYDVNGDEDLVVVDLSLRETGAEFLSDEDILDRSEVQFEYGSSEDYHDLYRKCASCNIPVALPEGWTAN